MRWGVGVSVIALALWAAGAVALFEPNRAVMACWFVWTKLGIPIACICIGSAARACIGSKDALERWKIVGQHVMYFLLAWSALPLVLGGLNHLPFGQRTEGWKGDVISARSLFVAGKLGTTVVVSSPGLGPRLQFTVDGPVFFEYSDGTVPRVAVGAVVRGFMGVPVACRLTRLQEMFSQEP